MEGGGGNNRKKMGKDWWGGRLDEGFSFGQGSGYSDSQLCPF